MAQYLGVVLILGVLIILHELGHFSAAKWVGVAVKQFAVGFGPPLWKVTRGETEYRLNAMPLGGYCSRYCTGTSCPNLLVRRYEITLIGRAANDKRVTRQLNINTGVPNNVIQGVGPK